MPISEQSADQNVPAISGKSTAGGDGVLGTGRRGVVGESNQGEGVHGVSRSLAAGVAGYNENPDGGPGVWGQTKKGNGVHGESQNGEGVHGVSHSLAAGVAGYNENPDGGPGVWGQTKKGMEYMVRARMGKGYMV